MENKIVSNSKTIKKRVANNMFKGKIIYFIILALFMLFILTPIFFMFITSMKMPLEIRMSGALFPKSGFTTLNLWRLLVHSWL
jgi:ABC-type glycerol-3-phosphate transport system permease component